MDFQNFKSAAQFPFPQSQSTFIVSNATPLIDFSLKMLPTGRVEPTIRISVVTQPLNFPVFNRVHSTNHLYVIIESWLVLRQTSCKRVISHSGVPLQSYSQRTHSLLYSLSCHGLCLSLQSIYYVLLCSGNTLQRLLYCAMPLLAFWSSRGCKEQNIPLFFSWLCSI